MDTLEQLKTKGSSETLKAMEGKDRQAPETFSGVASSLMRQQQKYIADVLTDKPVSIYAMDDYPAIRKQLFNNVLDALDKRFPLYNDKYVLALENVGYDDPEDISIEDQKKAIMEGKSVSRRVRGNWVLKDAATDKVLQRTGRMTLMRVPYMTERGTFIRNGHEYTFNSIMRLEPGVYTKKKNDDGTMQFKICIESNNLLKEIKERYGANKLHRLHTRLSVEYQGILDSSVKTVDSETFQEFP